MLTLQGVRKSYSGVEVLHGIDFDAAAGEVVAFVGANGAGRSTLIKVLCGAVRRDSGEIQVAGRPEALGSPHAAQALGIRTVHQELSLVPDLVTILDGESPEKDTVIPSPQITSDNVNEHYDPDSEFSGQ